MSTNDILAIIEQEMDISETNYRTSQTEEEQQYWKGRFSGLKLLYDMIPVSNAN